MRISFLAPSGYGKSTAIKILMEHYELENIRIADPLYELQANFYQMIKMTPKGEQDGELLQFLGMKIRKENPAYLIDAFKEKVACSSHLIITNDDCRPLDYVYLKEMQFIFIKINSYSRERLDHSAADKNNPNEWQTNIDYNYEVDNLSDMDAFEQNLILLMEEIKNDKMLYHPRTRTMPK